MNDRMHLLLLAALPAAWLLLTPPISAHEPLQTDAEAGQQISRGIAADQRIRAEHEKQEGLDSEQQDARARSDEGGRYYWWWPFRR
jgi:hypothetical protein